MAKTLTESAKSQNAENAQERKKQPEPTPVPVKALAGESILFPGLLGVSAMEPERERHAAFLGKPRFSHSANDAQRACVVAELQSTYGNQYLQRLVDSMNIQAKLIVDPLDGQYEREADSVQRNTAKVSRQPTLTPEIQRKADTGSEEAASIKPYVGRRKRNDQMDQYQDKKNIFGPHIFREYTDNWDLWRPLYKLIEDYWVKYGGNQEPIKVNTPELRKAAWNLLNGICSSREIAIIKGNMEGKSSSQKDTDLRDAVFVEEYKHYTKAHRLFEKEYDASNFRHEHEWAAVKFGFVSPPYMYHAKRMP